MPMSPAKVDVVFALPDRQTVRSVDWHEGMTAADAVSLSGLRGAAEDAGGEPMLGRFGRRIHGDQLLAPGDRVEICRPLVADPRAARRTLAARGLVMGDGGEVTAVRDR